MWNKSAHGDRFVVPAAITIEHLEDSKRGVCALLPYGTKYEDWYPSIVLSYASGRRTNRKDAADDCEGSGPGVMYAKGLMEFLHERGLQCFSGLQVPAGVDWQTFMLRLTGENGKREKPKVLIIILTAGLYQSNPCLKEISTAIENKIALLPVRFEDKLPAKEEQWTNLDDPELEMMKFHVQAKLNKLNNIPNPGTVLNRATSLQDIVAAIEKHLPAPASPATSTPTPQPPPPKPSGGPSEGPRFPVGSRVYVDQGHGQESLGYVATYNAAKGAYVVELGARGSGELEVCFDKDLRKDDNPMSLFIDSARERVGSSFGIPPSVMEREGVTTENAPASKPTPQPPASPTKPAPKPPPKHTQPWACSACTLINAPHRSTCRACETAAPPPPSIDQPPMPQPPALRFELDERVECRDRSQSWQVGTPVASVEPLKVQPDGAGWTAGYVWDGVRVFSPEAARTPKAPPLQPPVAPLVMERESRTAVDAQKSWLARAEEEAAEEAAVEEEHSAVLGNASPDSARRPVRRTATSSSRWRFPRTGPRFKTVLVSMTPRSGASGFFSSRGRALQDGRKLLLSKTAKGSLIAAAMLKVSKRAGEGGHQKRFALLVGDVLLLFMLAAQPEMPLPLRLWPAQVICLNQSTLVGAGGKQPEVLGGTMRIIAHSTNLGEIVLQADDHPTMERAALAMSLGVATVRRSRQQAKLSLARQLCHEKKLSLLNTQHMIDLLHKSQEIIYEEFDHCNAVCMHSGVMRQSLIDVTPFMPVSDFICEYCSCVIIPEEECVAAGEAAEAKSEERKDDIKKELQRKLQLDDETLMLARDVRSLRERRKALESEVSSAWALHAAAMATRQQHEGHAMRLELSKRLETMSREEVDKFRASLLQLIETAKKARAQAAAQLAKRQENLARREAAENGEEMPEAPAAVARSSIGRKLSFTISFPAAAAAPASLEAEHEDPMAYANRLVSIEVVHHEIERFKKAVEGNPRYDDVLQALVFKKEMIEMNVQCGMLTLPQYLDGLREAIAADKIRYKDKGDKVAGAHSVIMTKELKEGEENL
jgi:hypothetical protein